MLEKAKQFAGKASKVDLRFYRRILLTAGVGYLVWWLAVELLLPKAFNPFLSRLTVVLFILISLGTTYISTWAKNRVQMLALAGLWLITFHFYYLFYENGADANWIIGAYITVIAINLCFVSSASLMAYSIFVTFLSAAALYVLPHLRESIFLPGLLTLLIQANIGLRTRQAIVKNLIDSNERFQLLFDATFDGILVHEQGRIVDLNESMSKISGFSREELIGTSVLDVLDPSERQAVSEKFSVEDVIPYETKGLTKDGKLLDVEVRAKSFVYDRRPAKLVAVQDISDRKKAESERIKGLTLSENLRLRDEFISIASHELKTPISSLKLQTQMIERELKRKLNSEASLEEMREAMSLFHRQIDRLTELVESMLDVSRISGGRLVLEDSRVQFSELVVQCLALLAVQNSHAGSPPIESRIPEGVSLHGDRRRLQQVVENLISNAIKYGSGNPISVSVQQGQGEILLIVTDQGLGISEEAIPKIFDRFERAISSRNISGLGLGLYITKQIVEAHGGEITVSSQLGKGTTFTVRFPDR